MSQSNLLWKKNRKHKKPIALISYVAVQPSVEKKLVAILVMMILLMCRSPTFCGKKTQYKYVLRITTMCRSPTFCGKKTIFKFSFSIPSLIVAVQPSVEKKHE